jgi:hypothetical protein
MRAIRHHIDESFDLVRGFIHAKYVELGLDKVDGNAGRKARSTR